MIRSTSPLRPTQRLSLRRRLTHNLQPSVHKLLPYQGEKVTSGMSQSQISQAPALPFPISRISQKIERYFLFSADTITRLRREHHILGVLIGTLAQIPQQNVFLGIPLELQPEEAHLLVEKGLAYIVDDLQWHNNSYGSMTMEQGETYSSSLRRQGEDLARTNARESQKRSEQAFQRRREQFQDTSRPKDTDPSSIAAVAETGDLEDDETLFDQAPSKAIRPSPSPSASQHSATQAVPYSITPTSSHSLLPAPPTTPTQPHPTANSASYTLFKHLHSEGYYLSPGLRFGCQFLVYPGDPLRFHSHFLAVSAELDEEIDLVDLVGGGRLGTGVKKSWLIGGPASDSMAYNGRGNDKAKHNVRTFCVEWGGM